MPHKFHLYLIIIIDFRFNRPYGISFYFDINFNPSFHFFSLHSLSLSLSLPSTSSPSSSFLSSSLSLSFYLSICVCVCLCVCVCVSLSITLSTPFSRISTHNQNMKLLSPLPQKLNIPHTNNFTQADQSIIKLIHRLEHFNNNIFP